MLTLFEHTWTEAASARGLVPLAVDRLTSVTGRLLMESRCRGCDVVTLLVAFGGAIASRISSLTLLFVVCLLMKTV